MIGKTHISAGILAGEIFAVTTGNASLFPCVAIIAVSAAGAILPDIDQPQSTIAGTSTGAKVFSAAYAAVGKHRGFTHTLVFVALMWGLMKLIYNPFVPWAVPLCEAFAIGMGSHLLLDTLNEKGVMWFWPLWNKHIHLASIRTGSGVETFFRVLINLVATGMLVKIVYLNGVGDLINTVKGWLHL